MSTNAIAQPPVPEVVDARTHRLRHVYPVAPWLSAAILTTPGLIRYYRLQETGGTSAVDAASGSTGTYTGSPTLAQAGLWTPDDQTIYSVDLNGSSHYVTVPTIDFATACRSFSVESVVRADTLAATLCIFNARDADVLGQTIYIQFLTTGAVRFSFFDNLDTAASVVAAGTTYHVVCTYNSQTDSSAIYVNGAAVASGAVGPYTGVSTPTINIGRYATAIQYFDGRISDVAIYSRALTAAEVLAHAEAAGLASTSSSNGGLVARSSTLVLGRPYKAATIQDPNAPGSAGLAAGSYTHRLNDAGEFSVTFPNREGPDGIPHRERFDTAGHLEFIEHYRDEVLEFVGSVQRLAVDRQSVQVSGPDAFGLLRKAYEADREWTAAPADVVDAYTRVPVPVLADEFTDGTLSPLTFLNISNTSVSVSNGRATITGTAPGASGLIYLDLPPSANGLSLGDSWDVTMVAQSYSATATGTFQLQVLPVTSLVSGGDYLYLGYFGSSPGWGFGAVVGGAAVGDAAWLGSGASYPVTLEIRRRGRWAAGFVNGKLIGSVSCATSAAPGRVSINAGGFETGSVITVESLTIRPHKPFLRRGATYHDRHLPGDYPTGGLRGRYWSDTDLQGFGASRRQASIFTPGRAPRDERLDSVVDSSVTTIPASGAADYFSVRWFGAVYLRGDLGDYQFRLLNNDDGGRVWVAKTGFGEQVLDRWTDAAATIGPASVDSTLWGDRAAWVPIVVEYYEAAVGQTVDLEFLPPGAGSYTDPGGASITRGSWVTIPATSLSPLGCFDNRVQGASHFDLVKQAAETFALSLWCEPMQLESGEFPGRLLAKARHGRDTDVILQGEDVTPAEPLIGPAVETDATDLATSVRGGGAGIADGRGGQVTAEVFDATGAAASLFDLQAYADATDTNIRDLLAARLDAELALRSSPWQNVSGTPRAQERLADTFPLTGAYSAMRWRPGDAVRLWLPEVGVADAVPRQVLQVTREFQPDGRMGTSVGFRQRPKAVGRAIRGVLRAALAPQRSYQRQMVSLNEYVQGGSIAAAGFTAYAILALLPSDRVIKGTCRITINSSAIAAGIEINSVNRTTALGGTWTGYTEIDITPYAAPNGASDGRLFIRLQNTGGVASVLEFHVLVDVLR